MYRLIQTSQGLKLENTEDSKEQPIFVDFTEPSLTYRCQSQRLAHEPLIKAIGWKKDHPLTVCDATAGLGSDAFIMASIGATVTLLERNPIMLKLLKDGLQRAELISSLAPVLDRLTLVEQDSLDFLHHHPSHFDVVYCDPMFPSRKKSALVNKSMRALQNVVGVDQDAEALIQAARLCARKRVVVKRPRLAPIKTNPDFSYSLKACRFDVYLPHHPS